MGYGVFRRRFIPPPKPSSFAALSKGSGTTTVDIFALSMGATASVGDVTVSAKASTTLTGFGMTGSVGTVTVVSSGITVVILNTSLVATGLLGSSTVTGKGNVTLTGFQLDASLGNVVGFEPKLVTISTPPMIAGAIPRVFVFNSRFNVTPTMTPDHTVQQEDPTQPSRWRDI